MNRDNLQSVGYASSLVTPITDACVYFMDFSTYKPEYVVLRSLQVNLLSHFFVNLRETSSARADITACADGTLDASTMSDLRFNRIVGNLANSLSYDTDNESGTDDEEEAESEVDIEGDRCPDDRLESDTGGRIVEELRVGDEGPSTLTS